MFRAVPYHENYHKQVIDLLGLLWTNRDNELRDKVFCWKYLENPYCREPQFFLMLDGEKVVAVRGFFMNAYLLKEKVVYAGIPADAITHNDYRRKGLFEQLTHFAMEHNAARNFPDFYLSLSSNPLSASGHKKAGFWLLGHWSEWYRFSPLGFFSGGGKNAATESVRKYGKLKFKISSHFDANEMAGFFSEGNYFGFHLLKDEMFFSWRYRQPAFSYVFLEVKRENNLVGWASFFMISKGRAMMTDFRITDNKAFATGLKYFFKQMGLWAVQTRVFPGKTEASVLLKELGFRNYRTMFKWLVKAEPEPVLVKPAALLPSTEQWQINGMLLSEPQNWNLHLIDADGT